MSTAADKVTLPCTQCGQDLTVPASAIGKHGRCPNCQHVFPLELAIPATLVESPTITAESQQGYAIQPSAEIPNPYSPSAAQTSGGKYQHGFGWEHRGWDSGMMGGLSMMAIAALWFFGGLAFGIIFYYPVILFVIGVVGFFRGMFSGNVSGRSE
jgi:hypothetical protein